MSQLENWAMPDIGRLLDQIAYTLNLKYCQAISPWAVKSPVVLASVNGAEQ